MAEKVDIHCTKYNGVQLLVVFSCHIVGDVDLLFYISSKFIIEIDLGFFSLPKALDEMHVKAPRSRAFIFSVSSLHGIKNNFTTSICYACRG